MLYLSCVVTVKIKGKQEKFLQKHYKRKIPVMKEKFRKGETNSDKKLKFAAIFQ